MPHTDTSKPLSEKMKVDSEILLQTLMRQMQDGIVVCSPDIEMLSFNEAAAELLGRDNLSSGTSLYALFLRPPLEHALELLVHLQTKQPAGSPPPVQFMGASAGQDRFFRCRLCSVVQDNREESRFFILFFEDVTAWYSPDKLLHTKIEEFRAPMTNLRAAIENLTEHPEMSPVMRSAFENVMVQESVNLAKVFGSLDQACDLLMRTQGHLAPINSALLFDFIAERCNAENTSFSAVSGQEVDLIVDTFSLLLVLEHLDGRIREERKAAQLSCEASIGERFVYFDLIWAGEILPTSAVEAILEEKLPGSVGQLRVADILHSMGGDIWSQKHGNGQSLLRLALPLTVKGRG